jgi:molybdate/tungstate transport system permease protein
VLIDVAIGTPVVLYLTRHAGPERIVWEAVILISALMPPLALGILLSLAFGSTTPPGAWLLRIGLPTANSPLAFTATQIYVSIGYYIIAARAAVAAVPHDLERIAALLGLKPWQVFRRVTFPLSRVGLAAALSLAWVRALGEFGAVVVTLTIRVGFRCRCGLICRTRACRP